MSVLTSWVYPLQGIIYLLTAPQLLHVVLKFLVVVTAASLACTLGWLYLAWNWHLAMLARLFGVNLFTRLVTLLVLLSESALPVYLLFEHRFKRMQQQLFRATLQLKGVTVRPLQQADAEVLTGLLAKQRQQQEAAARSKTGLMLAAGSWLLHLVMRVLLKPAPKEGLLVRKARDVVTLAVSVLLPPLLPLMLYRDSHAEASKLLSVYWDQKGVTLPEGQELVASQKAWDLRGFGLVAASLGYVPVANWFLGLSNMVGAALYAATLEQRAAPLFPKRRW